MAKCIALAVMVLHGDDPKGLLSGEAFTSAGINGAVESDFFDWVVANAEGEDLVRRITTHVRRFRLAEVAIVRARIDTWCHGATENAPPYVEHPSIIRQWASGRGRVEALVSMTTW